jgi:hypothetical protein
MIAESERVDLQIFLEAHRGAADAGALEERDGEFA